MEFGIRFLEPHSELLQRCHFYDDQGVLLLVGECGAPWQEAEDSKIRITTPGGDLLATLDFPGVESTGKQGQGRIGYALIHDHAVYAIITKHTPKDPDGEETLPYFTVEVEGERWLVLGERGNGRSQVSTFVLCANAPTNLAVYADLMDACDETLGKIRRVVGDYDYDITFPENRFQQPHLISLALTFLIHQIP
ncbi:MAG: hypothetical protein CSB13_02290 [Chloroflexi bacterium]|nr:MAG: hypothetical protein CSB13_02290 [Chloroflexota bacterium]